MQINWFTFFAQIINFLIVLFLLNRFLYGPIRQAMETRQAALTDKFEEAEKASEQAREEAELFRARRQELEAVREQMLEEATQDAEEQRQNMIKVARSDVAAMQQGWYAAIESEKSLFLHQLRRRVSSQVFQLARRALADLANVEIEEAILQNLLIRLDELSWDEPVTESADKSTADIVVVRSSYALPAATRQQITDVLRTNLTSSPSHSLIVEFELSSQLICGIEIEFQHRRIAWSIRDYLDELENVLEESLEREISVQHSWLDLQEPNSAGGILPG